MVGKLVPTFFPKIFGPAQDQPLDAEVVRERFAALAAETGDGREAAEVADGFIRIAVENMNQREIVAEPSAEGRLGTGFHRSPPSWRGFSPPRSPISSSKAC